MPRNVVHKIQSRIFERSGLFNFLDYSDANNLLISLVSKIKKSGFSPEIVVGISNGGNYPSFHVAKDLELKLVQMEINHYEINLLGFNADEIVGMYRLAKKFGYKKDVKLDKDIRKEDVEGRKVLIVDDDSYSGITMRIALDSVKEKIPADVKTAVLHTFDSNEIVNFSGKLFKREEYFYKKFRFPWSKISPYYLD